MLAVRPRRFAALLAAGWVFGATSAALARPAVPETEPNDTKSQANLIDLFGCIPAMLGTSTGTSTTVPGAASADYFLIRETGPAATITEYTMTLTSMTPGHVFTIRGLSQASGVPVAGSDVVIQAGVASGTDRVCRFYGLTARPEIYCAVTGTAVTTAAYFVDQTCATVTPIPVTGITHSGPITIRPAASNTSDTDFWVYDAGLNPLPDFGHDDPNASGATRVLAPGRYYIAFGNFNTANNLASPIDDSFRNGNVTDFPGVVVSSSSATVANMNIEVVDGDGNVATGVGSKTNPFQVLWYRLDVGVEQELEANDTKAAATPASLGCGDQLTGTTTGAAATPGDTSLDYFLISTAPSAPGIYVNTLTLSSSTPGHAATLRGLTQTAGTPNPGTDATFQTSLSAGSDRINRFYTFGASANVYYRVSGTGLTTAPYVTTLTCDPVTPIPLGTSFQAGPITIGRGLGNTADTDWWVYDASFNPLPTFAHDETNGTAVTRTLAPGVYYVAVGTWNTANNLGSPADDSDRTSNVLDFPGVLASSSGVLAGNMNIDVSDAAGAAATGVGSKTSAFQVVWYTFTVNVLPEVEANETKATATPVAMECGYSVTGTTTGTSTTVAGAASADTFLLTSPPALPGIYEHVVTLTSTTPGHTATIRGLSQAAGVPTPGSDATLQTSAVAGSDRLNRFYSFGGGGQLYYRVTGGPTTTAPYLATLSCTPVTPIPVSTQLKAGPITIRPQVDAAADFDYWVYDSTFTPLPDFGHDDADTPGVSRTLAPGVYYIAFGNFNTANNLGSPVDDTFRTAAVLDFAGVVANTSTTTVPNMNVEVVDSTGTIATGIGSKTNPFQIVWYQFTVWSPAEIEPNDSKAAANPAFPACGDMLTGTTTGASTTVPGDASADYFLVASPAAAPGIYLNTITLTSTTPGHTASLRGLAQSVGVPTPGTDNFSQGSVVVGTDRVNKFYSFGSVGGGGRVYYRVTGAAGTTAPYAATITCAPVTPIAVSTVLGAGPITVRRAAGSTTDTDFWVYDASFAPLPDFGHDQPDAGGATRTLGPGVYYIAMSNFNLANNLGAPTDDTSRGSGVLDFSGVVANSSPTTIANMNVEVVDSSGTTAVGVGAKSAAFEIVWYQFTVVDSGACCCGSTCSITAPGACTGANRQFIGAGSVCNVPGNNITPCCRADFNHSGAVSVQDIFDFLSGFFLPDPCADVNGGGLSPQDLFDFLAAYFTGCP